MDEKNTEAAFKWIVGLLQKHSIPFQISGGFAARLYGSQRDLNDIDIGIPDDRFAELLPDVEGYITYGPAQYVDDQWDLKLMSLRYESQNIDIAGRTEIKFFDTSTQSWVPGYRDLLNSEIKEVFGLTVPVIPKEALIAYKKKLMREVDTLDLQVLEN